MCRIYTILLVIGTTRGDIHGLQCKDLEVGRMHMSLQDKLVDGYVIPGTLDSGVRVPCIVLKCHSRMKGEFFDWLCWVRETQL